MNTSPLYNNPMAQRIIHIHQLNFRENLETKLYRLEKGSIVHFRMGPSLFGKHIHLYCNHPPLKSEEELTAQNATNQSERSLDDPFSENFKPFERSKFYELEWHKGSRYDCDDTDLYAELELGRSGTFRYYFVVCNAEHKKLHPLLKDRDSNEPILCCTRVKWMEQRRAQLLMAESNDTPKNEENTKTPNADNSGASKSNSIQPDRKHSLLDYVSDLKGLPLIYRFPMSDLHGISVEDFEGDGCGYFLVPPTLLVGPENDPLEVPLNALRCQTLLAKSLGRFDQWKARVAVSYQSGFNAIHLTPVQELGISNSAYCIKDHFKLNPGFYLPINVSANQTNLSVSKMASPNDSEINLVKLGGNGKENLNSMIPSEEMDAENDDLNVEQSPENKRGRSTSLARSNRRVATMEELGKMIDFFKSQWGMLSMQDLVLNHAATNCQWIWEHPECGYNMVNSPHLKPAYLLDRSLWHFTLQVGKGEWVHRNVPPQIRDEFNLNAIRAILLDTVFPQLKIYEFYLVDVDKVIDEFRQRIQKMGGSNSDKLSRIRPSLTMIVPNESLKLVPDAHYLRMKSSIDFNLALALYNKPHNKDMPEQERIEICCNELRSVLHGLNHAKWEECESHLRNAAEAVVNTCRYYFIDHSGPRWPTVSIDTPIVYKYFTHPFDDMPLDREEATIVNDPQKGQYIMAHNGWVMNDDPLKNFAGPDSNVFLRRELIVWGDNVKLRYGEVYEDNPFLWDTMRKYSECVARIFHGIRIDNCHSTPLPVGEYLIDAARKVRPNLLVMAELFTQSEGTDNIFVNRFGITTLIREAMASWNAKELGRLVHRYGGNPVGSFLPPPTRKLVPQLAHAIFMDQTHDNPSLIEARSVFDVLPTSAIVCMSCCAIGSTRGVDELYPNKIDIVNDNRKYKFWTDKENKIQHKAVNSETGIIAAKRVLNLLHQELALEHYDQIFVDQIDDDVIAITRHSPLTHKSIILVAYTVFHNIGMSVDKHEKYIKPMNVPGVIEEIILEASLEYKPSSPPPGGSGPQFIPDPKYFNGLSDYKLKMRTNIHFYGSEMIEYHETGQNKATVQEIDFVRFYPGSVIAFRVNLNPNSRSAILKIRKYLSEFGYNPRSYSGTEIVFDPKSSSFSKLILGSCVIPNRQIDPKTLEALTVDVTNDLMNKSGFDPYMVDNQIQRTYSGLEIGMFLTQVVNRVLYKCEAEERADTDGKFGPYNVPNYGSFSYCGLKGMCEILKDIRINNDLGHPMCENLRKGDWMMTYIADRLKQNPHTFKIGEWFGEAFDQLSQIPRYLIPFYFEAIVNGAYRVIIDTTTKSSSKFIEYGSPFAKDLALCAIALVGQVKSSPLPALSKDPESEKIEQLFPSISAGLPHFSEGLFRSWGRDTFISLRGMLLLTGRFEEAKHIILAYGSSMRHGLIPNLVGDGRVARYNCRDAIWWWLQSIQDYCETLNYIKVTVTQKKASTNIWETNNALGRLPENYELLKTKLTRMYPADDSPPQEPGKFMQPLFDMIHESLTKHAQGLKFRERNAGPAIDNNMSDLGFNNSIGVDWKTGFVIGGNQYNCGTWMDKMGSSQLAGNKGVPATPRDGSAVEIVALCKSALRWLIKMKELGFYPYDTVNRTDPLSAEAQNLTAKDKTITLKAWDELISQNFERHYWIQPLEKFVLEGEEIIDNDGRRRPSVVTQDPSKLPSSPLPIRELVKKDDGACICADDVQSNKYINRRAIYKDTHGSSQPWTDYQLRCNFPVAMVVAPELFNSENAWKALKIVEDVLLGPLGIKTLDPSDWAYNGFYDNDNNSNDYKIAHGFNYHQGPEWLWPVGYFYRAKLYFAQKLQKTDPHLYVHTIHWIKEKLAPHYEMLKKAPWYGLPELTQENGRECIFGCYIQAWSTSAILETLFDMRTYSEINPDNIVETNNPKDRSI